MNAKRKGTRAEHRARRLLEDAGYFVVRAGGSLGAVDLVAINRDGIRLIQVKAGRARLCAAERAALRRLHIPPNAACELWTFRDRCRQPLIERLQ